MSVYPVSIMRTTSEWRSRTAERKSTPLISGIRWSETITWGPTRSISSKASAGLLAVSTSIGSFRSRRWSAFRMLTSSSTKRTVWFCTGAPWTKARTSRGAENSSYVRRSGALHRKSHRRLTREPLGNERLRGRLRPRDRQRRARRRQPIRSPRAHHPHSWLFPTPPHVRLQRPASRPRRPERKTPVPHRASARGPRARRRPRERAPAAQGRVRVLESERLRPKGAYAPEVNRAQARSARAYK